MYSHVLILADALEVLPKLHFTVDAAIIDPPYNTANKNVKELKGRKALSMDFGEWDYFSGDTYLTFCHRWIQLIRPVLKEQGNMLVLCKLEHMGDIRHLYEREGFSHHGSIIWHKTNPTPQIRKKGFLSSCEGILWATNGYDEAKVSYTFNFTTQKEMHNFVETPICMGRERTSHPTQKPLKLVSHLVRIFTQENDVILDCFAGSGTVMEAAVQSDRNTINIENVPSYYQLMQKRAMKHKNTLLGPQISILEITDLKDLQHIDERTLRLASC